MKFAEFPRGGSVSNIITVYKKKVSVVEHSVEKKFVITPKTKINFIFSCVISPIAR